MNHADALTLLMPVELAGVFAQDTALEGAVLDEAEASAARLLREMFPDRADALLPDWERVCGLTPGETDPLQARRDAVLQLLRSIGGLSGEYFIDIAATFGWTISIDELKPFMAGCGRAGDSLYEESACFIWRVNVSGNAVYRFRSGVSAAGEMLTWWIPYADLETLLNELKPAHTYVFFNYE